MINQYFNQKFWRKKILNWTKIENISNKILKNIRNKLQSSKKLTINKKLMNSEVQFYYVKQNKMN